MRFEISFELLKANITSLVHRFRAAFVLRNYTVHTYNEGLADYVYERLGEASIRFRAMLNAVG